jgi:hypothetical protein
MQTRACQGISLLPILRGAPFGYAHVVSVSEEQANSLPGAIASMVQRGLKSAKEISADEQETNLD